MKGSWDNWGLSPTILPGKWDEFAALIFDPGNFENGEIKEGTYLHKMLERTTETGERRYEMLKNYMGHYASMIHKIGDHSQQNVGWTNIPKVKEEDRVKIAKNVNVIIDSVMRLMHVKDEAEWEAYMESLRSE